MKIRSKIDVTIPQGNRMLTLERNKIYECRIVKDCPVTPYIKFEGGVASIELLNRDFIEVVK